MDLTTSSFIDSIKSFLDYIIDAKFVDIRHEVSRYVQLFQYLSLSLLGISEANVNNSPWIQTRSDPVHQVVMRKLLHQLGYVEADGHPVHVPGVAGGHGVDVRVGVHPDHHRVRVMVQTGRDCAQTNAVVTTQGQCQVTMTKDLLDCIMGHLGKLGSCLLSVL